MKRLLTLFLVCLMVITLAACGSNTDSNGASNKDNDGTDTNAAVEPITLKFNLVKSSSDPQYEWYGRFFDDVNKATNGAIETEIYTSESLGVTADVLEQASQGEAVIADCDVAYLANYVPDFAAVMSPI